MEEYILKHGLKNNPNWYSDNSKNQQCDKLINTIINSVNSCPSNNDSIILTTDDCLILTNLIDPSLSPNGKIEELVHTLVLKKKILEENQITNNKIMNKKKISDRLLILLLKNEQITIKTKEFITKFVSEISIIERLDIVNDILRGMLLVAKIFIFLDI